MAESLPEPTDPKVSLLGDFQQPVPTRAGDGCTELAGGDSTESGDFQSRGYGDCGAPSGRDGRNIAAQAQSRRRGAYRIDPRRLVAARARNVQKRDHEQFS